MSFLGGSPAKAPAPPKFKPVNTTQATDLAQTYDTLGYNLSDQNFLSRFPGLVAIRDSQINDAVNQVSGPLDPTVQNTFATTGESGALSAFGGGTGGIGEEGSAARGAIASSIANQTQAKQDYDRLQLQNVIGLNPERQFGLSGGDLLNVILGNVAGKNQSNYQAYQASVQNANAQNQAGASENAAIVGLVVSLIGAAAKGAAGSDVRLKRKIEFVGSSPSGIPIYEFEYRNQPGQRYRGTIAQEVQKVRPDAIVHVGSMLYVQYGKLDVALQFVGTAV